SPSGALLEKQTYGDWTTGIPFVAWETQSEVLIGLCATCGAYRPTYLDMRPTKIVHWRDGVTWTETFAYDMSSVQLASGPRTWGNVTNKTIYAGTGASSPLAQTTSSYLHNPSYNALNLVRLVSSQSVLNGAGNQVLSRIDNAYDENAYPL